MKSNKAIVKVIHPRRSAAGETPRTGNAGLHGTWPIPAIIHVEVWRFVHPHGMQPPPAVRQVGLQALPDVACDVFGSGHHVVKGRYHLATPGSRPSDLASAERAGTSRSRFPVKRPRPGVSRSEEH